MYKVRVFTILAKRFCKETRVVENGDALLLVKEGGFYRTLMREKSGFEYWIREFFSFEKAETDFNERVEVRLMIEELNNIKK